MTIHRGLLLLASAIAAAMPVSGQGLETLREEILDELNGERWEQAHALLEDAVTQYDGRAPVLFGPEFGWYWYHKGQCELKLGKWIDARASFMKCYTKYKNPRAPDAGTSTNEFQTEALKGLAEAEYQLKAFEQSAALYRRYLAERERDGARQRQ